MAQRLYTLRLTGPELDHILTCVYDSKVQGEYWGRKDQHTRRADRIMEKISAAKGE